MALGAQQEPVYVLATTPAGTAQALREAGRRAGRDRRVVLLVPVPLVAGGGKFASARLDEASTIARATGINASAYAFVCHRPHDVLLWFPVGDATIVVGGEQGQPGRSTAEENLVETLSRGGHRVIFARTEDPVPS